MPSNRLFQLVCLLLEKGQMTAPDLARHLEVSVRTIYRDLDTLSAAGVPVRAVPGKGGGVSLMEHYVLRRAAFTEAERQALLSALQSLPLQTRSGAQDALTKLSALLRGQDRGDWLQVDLSRWGAAEADTARFDALREAVLSRRAVAFTYVSAYGPAARRKVLPARLVFKGQAWYLQGFCQARQDYRTFRLSRILELETLEPFDQSLAPPPVEGTWTGEASFLPVRLRFSPLVAHRVYDEFDGQCVTQAEDGALVVSVSFPEDPWLYGYLLSFGLGVEVLEPASLRRRLALLAKKVGAHHENPDRGCQGACATMETSHKQEESFMEPRFCQSCGMPLDNPALRGTERDGTPSPHYCSYCYQNGAFTGEMTMEEMIDFCVPIVVQANPGMTEDQARDQMRRSFPLLLRWRE